MINKLIKEDFNKGGIYYIKNTENNKYYIGSAKCFRNRYYLLMVTTERNQYWKKFAKRVNLENPTKVFTLKVLVSPVQKKFYNENRMNCWKP